MNGTYGTSIVATQPSAKLIDDLLRRELRVGDPRNATEVVTALRQRYAADAARIDQEAAGLPFRNDPVPAALTASRTSVDTPGYREEQRVRVDLAADLAALIESRDAREWAPEFRGWRDVLLREFAEGTAAARFASDPAMRDRGFLSVRKLSDYARVARLVGILNLILNEDFRRLAATLDDAANVIRILMGEALFASGLADGGHLFQVSLADLRQRREAVILALRRLGGFNAAGSEGEWGDDLAAYGDLLDDIKAHSAPELNVYLREELLAPMLDGLIGSVSRQDPETLRQLAATAPVEIARIRRLLDVMAVRLTSKSADISPGLTAFTDSLRLFANAFDQNRTGARLIDLSVPLPLAAQQLNEGDAKGRGVLLQLIIGRGQYAREVDCFLSCCGGTPAELTMQAKLDMFLSHIDRAVDLYSRGSSQNGPEEQRASVYKRIADVLNSDLTTGKLTTLSNIVGDIVKALDSGGTPSATVTEEVFGELCAEEVDWDTLVRSLVPNCVNGAFNPFKATREVLNRAFPGSSLNCGHSSDFKRTPSVRLSLQRIADCTCTEAQVISKAAHAWRTPGTTSSPLPPASKPAPRVRKFFEQLDSCRDEHELYNNASARKTQDHWNDVKTRPELRASLSDDEVNAIDDLMACTDPKDVDEVRVHDVCKQVLSR